MSPNNIIESLEYKQGYSACYTKGDRAKNPYNAIRERHKFLCWNTGFHWASTIKTIEVLKTL